SGRRPSLSVLNHLLLRSFAPFSRSLAGKMWIKSLRHLLRRFLGPLAPFGRSRYNHYQLRTASANRTAPPKPSGALPTVAVFAPLTPSAVALHPPGTAAAPHPHRNRQPRATRRRLPPESPAPRRTPAR